MREQNEFCFISKQQRLMFVDFLLFSFMFCFLTSSYFCFDRHQTDTGKNTTEGMKTPICDTNRLYTVTVAYKQADVEFSLIKSAPRAIISVNYCDLFT